MSASFPRSYESVVEQVGAIRPGPCHEVHALALVFPSRSRTKKVARKETNISENKAKRLSCDIAHDLLTNLRRRRLLYDETATNEIGYHAAISSSYPAPPSQTSSHPTFLQHLQQHHSFAYLAFELHSTFPNLACGTIRVASSPECEAVAVENTRA